MIPHNFEIDITSGVVKISRFGSGPLLEAIRDTIVDDVVYEMTVVANEVSQEAGTFGGAGEGRQLHWFLAPIVGRWPWDTGQSSALLGRGLPITNQSVDNDDGHRFVAHVPEGTGIDGESLEYMAEIEHEGRGNLEPVFLLHRTAEYHIEDWDEQLGPRWAAAAERVV